MSVPLSILSLEAIIMVRRIEVVPSIIVSCIVVHIIVVVSIEVPVIILAIIVVVGTNIVSLKKIILPL